MGKCPAIYTLHLHPAPSTLLMACTLYLAPCSMHPVPCTLCSAACTLCPVACTLYPVTVPCALHTPVTYPCKLCPVNYPCNLSLYPTPQADRCSELVEVDMPVCGHKIKVRYMLRCTRARLLRQTSISEGHHSWTEDVVSCAVVR